MLLLLVSPFLCYLAFSKYVIELHVFSSEANPVYEITQEEFVHFEERYFLRRDEYFADRIMGYRGFTLQDLISKNQFSIVDNKEAELFLLELLVKNIALDSRIADHVTEVIEARTGPVMLDHSAPVGGVSHHVERLPSPNSDHVVIKGPDCVTKYDPDAWNQYPIQGENNCYNYANDIRTDTFAQPGRGTGQKWQENSCADVGAAAEHDGLIRFTGDPLGNKKPDKGHFIALFMWYGVNFHWAKKDLETTWSHKPGGTAVRNVDNAGQTINDPSKADMSPYRTFCGYYVGIPSLVTVE